jgi:hypothetical protein
VCADRQNAYGLERLDRFDEAIAEQSQTPLTDPEQDEVGYVTGQNIIVDGGIHFSQ